MRAQALILALGALGFLPAPVTAGPVIFIPALIAGTIGMFGGMIWGTISNDKNINAPTSKRAIPAGVPQYVFDMCSADLLKAANGHFVITTMDQAGGLKGVLIEKVPATCMTLATVVAGDPANGPHPIPMGSDSLQYNDLTAAQYSELVTAFTSNMKVVS